MPKVDITFLITQLTPQTLNIFDTHLVQFLCSQDYTGEDASVDNFFAVLLGNKTVVKGGSGKVVNS